MTGPRSIDPDSRNNWRLEWEGERTRLLTQFRQEAAVETKEREKVLHRDRLWRSAGDWDPEFGGQEMGGRVVAASREYLIIEDCAGTLWRVKRPDPRALEEEEESLNSAIGYYVLSVASAPSCYRVLYGDVVRARGGQGGET